MKTTIKISAFLFLLFATFNGYAQQNRQLQFFRPVGQEGLNVFETSKADTIPFTGLYVRVGGDFAMQFQSLDHSSEVDTLVQLGSDFNLPTANLNLDVQLADGMRMHLRTFLSSRHHQESWVKGGHIQIDKLDFIKPGFLEGFMNIATVRIGLDEFNYGDAHFRRTDNARAIYNPFVGNYIMDSYSTEAFGELTLQKSGWLGVVGLSNGKLNQNVTVTDKTDNKVSLYGKLGYDSQVSEDLRLRLTASAYVNKGTSTGAWLYGGDRSGSRYYHVMEPEGAGDNAFSGRFNARFTELTAIQINPFIKFKGLEFFGIYEVASGSADKGNGVTEGSFTQVAGELVYRFGSREQLYVGGRYNTVSGSSIDGGADMKIDRLNIGAGWFLTNNVMAKLEYVDQNYSGDGWNGSTFQGGQFNGIVLEAAISF